MKAVLLMRECILPAKAAEVASDDAKAALRALAQTELSIIILDPRSEGSTASAAAAARLGAIVEAAGGRVDAVVWCPHATDEDCGCWYSFPGLIQETVDRFDLQPNECYLIAAKPVDVEMAIAAGVRPILHLDGQRIGDLLGDRVLHKDYPLARTLIQGVEYIASEERATAQLGRPRQIVPPSPGDEASRPMTVLPAVTPISRAAVAASRRNRLRPREVGHWLSLLIVGGVWLSLGIAYLLTHLYREQPFPAVAYYITLQFIPRLARGVLFILTGVALVLLASRSYIHTLGNHSSQTARRH